MLPSLVLLYTLAGEYKVERTHHREFVTITIKMSLNKSKKDTGCVRKVELTFLTILASRGWGTSLFVNHIGTCKGTHSGVVTLWINGHEMSLDCFPSNRPNSFDLQCTDEERVLLMTAFFRKAESVVMRTDLIKFEFPIEELHAAFRDHDDEMKNFAFGK
jgi:hypothetical protein